MKRYGHSILVWWFVAGSLVWAQETIRICSFNIAELGEGNHALTRDEEGIARILHTIQPDLLAIQEVGVAPECFEQVKVIQNHLNRLAEEAGSAAYLSDISDEFATGDERYAFLWRQPVQITSSVMKMQDTQAYQGSRFVRTPVYAYFKAKNFDFALMNVHLYTRIENGDRGRKFEYQELVKWIRHTSANTDEQDLLVVGDFNRYREFGPQAVWAENVGIEAFDNYPEYALCTFQQIKYIISDHRPIWFDIRIDMEDDDGIAEEEPDESQPAAYGPYLGPVIGNKNSKIYHHPNSPSLFGMSAGNKVEFTSVGEAEAAGYKAAKNWDWNR
jgi:endonuclease/exonuclease/phosphatase family metal-dependent hydrolase